MKIVITGANGHVGERALNKLCIGNEVHAVVRAIPLILLPSVTYHSVDLSSNWSTDILPDHVDAVIHLAQSRNFREFPQQALEIFEINTVATVKLLDYALRAGAKRFVLASTGGLHRPSSSVITNDSLVDPPDGSLEFYFRSKLAAELLARTYRDKMDITILRPFFIYGPGQSPDKLISRLITSIRDRQSIKLAGKDGLVINPVFVDDVADLLLAILETAGSRTLMVAGPDALSMREIANLIAREIGCVPSFHLTEEGDINLVADHRCLETLLRRPMTRFFEGISRTIRCDV